MPVDADREGTAIYALRLKLPTKIWDIMVPSKIETHGIMLIITGIVFASVLYPEDTKASILVSIDEPTGNAYDDLYVAEEENTTFTLESSNSK
jgi:hypothetical protein